MAKIKVVQIAIAASTDDTWDAQYLDDKGRVWYQDSHFEDDTVSSNGPLNGTPARIQVTEWKQLELPDEPA